MRGIGRSKETKSREERENGKKKEAKKERVLVALRKVEEYKKAGWKEVDIDSSDLPKTMKDQLTRNQDMVLVER